MAVGDWPILRKSRVQEVDTRNGVSAIGTQVTV
jgi:hypothetical protein